jgi:deoxyribodipyrimidine photolyase-related protein
MEMFYRWQRKRLDILMDGDKPVGGQWNYDADNRQPLPKDFKQSPKLPVPEQDTITKEVRQLISSKFANNPGKDSELWLPVTHKDARNFLDDFIKHKMELFGPYEDAMKPGEAFLYHSALSALMNIGLLTVDEIIQATLKNKPKNFASLEGFIRQVIGWREYMYGHYWQLPSLSTDNFFGFTKKLEPWWYDFSYKNDDLPEALTNTLKTTERYGYNHHIERLMVLGNWFLINQYNPHEVNRWFMSMYVDAYEWVMLPNVIGMSQYADGGKVATKPYISGDAYLKKMGGFKASDNKALSYTEKYWQFLYDQRDKLAKNPRLSLAVSQAKKRHQS